MVQQSTLGAKGTQEEGQSPQRHESAATFSKEERCRRSTDMTYRLLHAASGSRGRRLSPLRQFTQIAYAMACVAVVLFAFGTLIWRVSLDLRPAANTHSAPVTAVVTVSPGESLWTLAQQYGDPDKAVWERVEALAKANELPSGASLVAGQRLTVPVGNPVELVKLQNAVASN